MIEKLDYYLNEFEEKLFILSEKLNNIKEKLLKIKQFEFSENKKKQEKEIELIEKYLENLKTIIGNHYYSSINNLVEDFNKLKNNENSQLYKLFNCFLFERCNFKFIFNIFDKIRLLNLKVKDLDTFLENIGHLKKELEEVEKLITLSLEYLNNNRFKDFKSSISKIIKKIDSILKIVESNLSCINIIKRKLNYIKKEVRTIKVEKLIFSERAVKSLKEILKKSRKEVKLIFNKLEELLSEGYNANQLREFLKHDNESFAKFPEGHTNLRFILNYSLLKKGILFINDITLHSYNYKEWHKDNVPSEYNREKIVLEKEEIAIIKNAKNCIDLIEIY
ncbi:MAG: hypothetical protein ABGW69_02840 [Nanoarchaeota archaeon]